MSWRGAIKATGAAVWTVLVFMGRAIVFVIIAVDTAQRVKGRRNGVGPGRSRSPRRVEKISSSALAGAVPIDETPLIEQQRWQTNGNTYTGFYRTSYGAWPGEIVRKGDRFKVFIWLDPPIPNIRRHNRWICFRRRRGKKYQINLAHNPRDKDPSAIVFYVQKLIAECFAMN